MSHSTELITANLMTGGPDRIRTDDLRRVRRLMNSSEFTTATTEFEQFLRVDLNQSERTIQGHKWQIKRFLNWLGDRPISVEELRNYLALFQNKSVSTRANALKSLRVFFNHFLHRSDLVESFKFPKRSFQPRQLPTKEDLRRFFDALENDRDKAVFLVLASSGLRKGELLSLTKDNLNLETRTIIPRNAHENGTTKNSWISFFNQEALDYLKRSKLSTFPSDSTIRRAFKRANQETGLKITPQTLRFWFANELGRLGVADRFIDAFQGRTPRTVLARHYSDFSPERLREVYNEVNLTVLS